MLMHHTWLKQQEQAAEKPVEKKPAEQAGEQNEQPSEPKKTGGRRKTKE